MLAERIAASPEFAKNLQQPETMGKEGGEELDEGVEMDGVVYDEIDSSRTIEEEVAGVILQKAGPPLSKPDAESDDGDMHVVGAHMERFTGREFSSRGATSLWMEWDAGSYM